MKTKFVAMTAQDFTKFCAAISKLGVSFTVKVQEAAVQAAVHSIVHGDVMFGQRLYDALSKSSRRDSLIRYLETQGNFEWSKADKKLTFKKRFEKAAVDDDFIDKLDNAKWEDAKPEPEIVSKYDVAAAFDRFLKTMDATIKKAAAAPGGTVRHLELAKDLHAVAARYDDMLYGQGIAKKNDLLEQQAERAKTDEVVIAPPLAVNQ